MSWVAAVDSSYDELTEAEAHRLKAAGVELYIQALTALPSSGLEQPRSRVISLRNATYAGLKIAGYALISGDLDFAVAQIDYARVGVPSDLWIALEFCAVDVEVTGSTSGATNLACGHVTRLLQGKPSVVYTNYDTWVNKMGNPPKPEGSKLWDANWNNRPGVHNLYGGWTQADLLLHQYTGGTMVEGQFVDRDVWWVPDPQPQPETEPTTAFEWYRRFDAKLDRILAAVKE